MISVVKKIKYNLICKLIDKQHDHATHVSNKED